MSLLNKFIKNEKKENKKLAEESQARLGSVIAEIQEVCSRRGINYYEMMDIMLNMQRDLSTSLAKILHSNNEQINKLKEENDKLKPKQSPEQEDKK